MVSSRESFNVRPYRAHAGRAERCQWDRRQCVSSGRRDFISPMAYTLPSFLMQVKRVLVC